MTKAFVLIHCETGREFYVYKKLQKIPEATEIWVTYGPFDLLCKLETTSEQYLKDIVINDIRKIPHIKETETLLVYV